jgi:hypothetical protein
VNVCRKIFHRIEQPQELLPVHARNGFIGPIPWGDLFSLCPLLRKPMRNSAEPNRFCCSFTGCRHSKASRTAHELFVMPGGICEPVHISRTWGRGRTKSCYPNPDPTNEGGLIDNTPCR